ncbi:class I SAM-dependent methyltransferase [uncultured Pseudodesulfovibrio sp.]|uniref:class I SAM-dependent methyltransferase n=1 Tax=uncultured Pseudodesulfovibrio sp. TaxID=2035858 RepID=UPI0029C8EAA4|nr:class I SAM-dependent methyltransferase [uncultured Pseudodesulfovibrio sp.]
MNCRHCHTPLKDIFIDLVNQPPSNSFLKKEQLDEPETYFPLKLFVCPDCFLVQIDEYKNSQEIFSDDYVYFSSFSSSWVEHAKRYVDMAEQRFSLDAESMVMEIASNDGYLLQWFVKKGIPCLGIEPTGGTADAAEKIGVPTRREFFGTTLARQIVVENKQPDLLLGNNVLAHVPDINDFVEGLAIALKQGGTITMEFPHLMQLVSQNQFDTIYHEHFSYLSLVSVSEVFASHGLTIFDVEELPTHGGSLRIFARHTTDHTRPVTESVKGVLAKETSAGMTGLDYYRNFQSKADTVKADLLEFLIRQKRAGKTVAAYGAAAKGNTLLNYCGIKTDLISFCVDASPHKQNLFLPGSHIPVLHPDKLKEQRPDFILILPWNIQNEIMEQHSYVSEWGCKFVTAISHLAIH